MSVGVNGLVIKRLADIKTEIEGAFQSAFGVDNVDLSNDGPIGQVVGIMADREASLWEILEWVSLAMTETGASGTLLDQLYLMANMIRLQAASSRTVAADGVTGTTLLSGDVGTIVPAGFVLETSDTAARFLLEESVTLDAAGEAIAIFASEDLGPIPCLTGTLTVIPTPLAGLDTATNTLDARVGRLVETDAEFRARRAQLSATVTAATTPALLSALLNVVDVVEVRIVENRGDSPDDEGRPGHSFEALVRGGDDQEILDKIFELKPCGIESYGNVVGTSVDEHGDAQPVEFSRPTTVPVYIIADLTVDGAFPTDGLAQVTSGILAYGQEQIRMGLTVSPFKIQQTIETPGIVIFDMKIGIAADPTSEAPLAIGNVEIAEFDSSRLIVRRVN